MVRATQVLSLIAIFILEEGECKKRCFSITNGNETQWFSKEEVTNDFKARNEEDVFRRVYGRETLKQPEDLKIKKATQLLWKSDDSFNTSKRTKYFLLKICSEKSNGVSTTRYFLLGNFTVKPEWQFTYKCLPKCITKGRCERIEITLWPLPYVNGNDTKRTYRTNENSKATLTIQPENSTLLRLQREVETCNCEAKIVIVQLVQLKPSVLTTTTIVNNKRVKFRVQFYLDRNGREISRWHKDTETNQNKMKFKQTIHVKPGRYVLKAEKYCKEYDGYSLPLSCDKDMTKEAISNPCITTGDVKENEDVTVSALKQKDGPSMAKQSVTLMVSFPVIGVLFLVITAGLTCIYCCGRKPVRYPTRLSSRPHRNQELVAVIYVNEYSQHRRRVYRLCAELLSKGIRALPIDELTRNREMIENWIAEGERISNTCGSFLFVLSHSLVKVCRSPNHNRHTTTGSSTDETPPVGHSRLPLVVLNGIKTHALFNDVKNVQTVYFENNVTESAVEGRDLCSQFTDTHSSIISSETHKVCFQDDDTISYQDLNRLVYCFKNRTPRPIISYVA